MAGNTWTNQVELGEESLENDSSLAQRALDSVRNTAKISVAALWITAGATAALAQEQRTYDYTPVVATESWESCETPNPELTESELVECFGLDFWAIDDEDVRALVADLWSGYTQEQKERSLWLFAWGFSAVESIAIVADNTNRSVDVVRAIHTRAIELGRGEYIQNMIASHPTFTEGRWASLSDGAKAERINRYYDDIMNDFLTGTDNDSLAEFVEYAPSFAYYVATFPEDFPLADRLMQEIRIAEWEARIWEQQARIADLEGRIAALDRLQRALQWDV